MRGLYQECALAVGGGLLLAAGFWPRASIPWAGWVALVPFLWLIYGKTPARGFRLGWLYGTAAWMGGVYWMPGPIARYLQLPTPAAWTVFVLLWGFHGLVFALAAWLALRLGSASPLSLARAFVPLAVAGEGFFPMLLPPVLAYTQHDHLPALQSLELFGTAGLAWLLAGFNAALFAVLRPLAGKRPVAPAAWTFLAAMGTLVLLNEAYGWSRIRAVDSSVASLLRSRPIKVALLQGALAPGAARSGPAALEAQKRLTEKALERGGVNLVIWPESTFGFPLEFDGKTAAVAGAPAEEFFKARLPYPAHMLFNSRAEPPGEPGAAGRRPRGFNSAFLKGPGGEFLGLTKKRVLFPFGEFVPGGEWLPALYRLSPRAYALTPGGPPLLLRAYAGAGLGVLICYEDLKPALARDYSELGADILVNMTEDMMLGAAGAEQHLLGAVPRAIENRKFFLRAANFGVTAVIDPVGRVAARLPAGVPGTLVETVAALPGRTPHTAVGRTLYWLALAALAPLAFSAFKP